MHEFRRAVRAEPIPYSRLIIHASNMSGLSARSADLGFCFTNGFVAPAAGVRFNRKNAHRANLPAKFEAVRKAHKALESVTRSNRS